ncbi:heat shock protein Hsp88 [Pyrenophora tritici-repentis]|nr:HSP70 multi-domain protein [Pyrenophora tritici-repentis]KAI1537562.1 heat shock protein Hsp88 [Pyrenophora tritici-repentis]
MSVVGVDLGTLNSVIAVARNRGVDVIANEVSNRATPSLVGFGPKSRYIGETAKNQEISNLKNTVSSFVRLAGRNLQDPDVQVEQKFVSAPLVDMGGQVGAEVTYLGKKEQFTATQITAMFLTKMRATASAELKLPVNDVVLSCPVWYTDSQRRAILDAAEIAGLKCLRLINDNTAVALGWGITKLDLPAPEEKPRRIVFVNIGHSNYTATVVEFKKGELAVKSSAWDRHYGGRYIDQALVEHFAKEFKEKYKIDVMENGKARLRLAAGVEKLKKVLSANNQAPINVESIMNDVDVRGMLKRDELEELIKPLIDRATAPIEQALAEAGLTTADIDAVEMVGGCTRVPALKTKIQDYFGKPLSFTLNQDEAVARGCAFSCAILSPVFRVRDFVVHDMVNYPVEFTWEKSEDIPDEDTNLTVFNKGNVMPSTKILTFYRKHPFDLEARYAKPEQLPGKMNPWIGRFSVKGVKEDPKGDFMICKLKARLNLHGVLNVESGYYVEETEVEEPIPESPSAEKKEGDVRSKFPTDVDNGRQSPTEPAAKRRKPSADPVLARRPCALEPNELTNDAQAMDVDKDAPKEPPKMRKVKKQQRKGDLPLSAGTASLDEVSKQTAAERENSMIMEDKLVADTENEKNNLESFIYELKDKILDVYAEFASDDEKARLNAKLETIEEWLYDEGDDASKAQKQEQAPPAEDSKDTEMADAEGQKPDGVEETS